MKHCCPTTGTARALVLVLTLTSNQHNMLTAAFPPRLCNQVSSNLVAAARIGAQQGWVQTRRSIVAEPSLTQLFSTRGGGKDGELSRRGVFKVIGGAIIALPVLGEWYSRSGSSKQRQEYFIQPPLPSWDDSIQDVTLVFHGAGGQDIYTDALMQTLGNKTQGFRAMVDWSAASQNLLQASFNGEAIGREIATQLLSKSNKIQNIHLIGISVGAFAADAAVSQLKSIQPIVNVQLTLLDPFCQRGVIAPKYGNRNYGKDANYTQQFLNTDDPVPSTNAPVSLAVCYDVTSIRPPEVFGHDWPLVYYTQEKDMVGEIVSPERQKEPGTVITITSK